MYQNTSGKQDPPKNDTGNGVLKLSFLAESANIKQNNIIFTQTRIEC